MFVYKLEIAYDGTAYSGWQIQPNGPSIQHTISEQLCKVLQLPEITLIGSGRTDAGVHALGQVAHFRVSERVDENKVLHSLNCLLPKDIRIKSLSAVPSDFHAQYSAKGKIYHYYLHLDKVLDPFRRQYSWHIQTPFDSRLLIEAASYFVGTHDFTSFANEAHLGSAAKNPVRELYRLDPVPVEGGLRLEFEGNGFLYKMVRNIVGTLVEVGLGKRSVEEIPVIMAARDRGRAGQAAPPQGLFLVTVHY